MICPSIHNVPLFALGYITDLHSRTEYLLSVVNHIRRSWPSQNPVLFRPNIHPNLVSQRRAVRSEIPCLPVRELCRAASILVISTAAFASCRCFATASHIPFGEACHLATFRYSLTAKRIPSSKYKDFRFTCFPWRGQGGGDLVGSVETVHKG